MFAERYDELTEGGFIDPDRGADDHSRGPRRQRLMRRLRRTNAARHLEWNRARHPSASRDDIGANGAVSSTLEVDDVDQRRFGGHDALHERFDGLAKEDAVEISLLEADGVIAKEIERGDYLHSSVLAC